MAAIGTIELGIMYMLKDNPDEHFTVLGVDATKEDQLAKAVDIQFEPYVTHVQLVERKWVKSK